ncbi:cytidine deaminase [Peribacillus alkalitolerans]|uniref:cytidine deaminase n=1 Tax=Peribacillus alkalitolerans TaxID=1550385 RepID=UPI0013D30FE4|nr:cytidine deaminase [Peribacillus alkalitolerans]
MNIMKLTEQDQELVQSAQEIIKKCYELDRHHIGAALRTKSGEIFTAVHVEAYIGRITVCAEAMVIGKAISEGFKEFDTIVAVRHPHPDEENQEINIVTPCGMCRELLSDYGNNMKVIIPFEKENGKCDISAMLPMKYTRENV